MTAPPQAAVKDRHETTLFVALGLSLLSGSCGLAYEVLWMRLLIPVFGLSVDATTTVLCAFMGGLGLGSLLAPSIIRRWKTSMWLLYALIELGLVVTALIVPYLVPAATNLFAAAAPLDLSGPALAAVRFLLCGLLLLLPATLLGLTLPVLLTALDSPSASRQRTVSLLYGINTLGGVLGCIAAGFFLIERLGLSGTVACFAALNGVVAIAALVIFASSAQRSAVIATPEAASAERGENPVLSKPLILALFGFSGFVAFGYELCWFRLLIFYFQSTTYSFSMMLSIYLVGLAIGSLYYNAVIRKRFSAADTPKIIGLLQLLIALAGVVTLHTYGALTPLWALLVAALGANSWWLIVIQEALLTSLVILPATFCMGISFPLLVDEYQRHRVSTASAVGHLYAVNTLGAIAGTVLTGFIFFDLLGLQHTLTLLALLSFVLGSTVLFAARHTASLPRFIPLKLAVLVAVMLLITPNNFLKHSFEKFVGNIMFFRESASDITFVYERDGHRVLAFSDGRGTSSTGERHNYVNRLLAYSAMVSHPSAKDVLVISMGCGNSASAFAAFPLRSLDIVDISSGPFEAAPLFWTNKGILDRSFVTTYVQDGRNYLLRTNKQYDIIHLELPTIHTEGVIYLYTKEFYELARSKLRPDGLLSQWIDAAQTERAPSYSLIHTMLGTFPNATVWTSDWAWWVNGKGAAYAPTIDYPAVERLFAEPAIVEDMQVVGTNLADVLAKLVAATPSLLSLVRDTPLVTDNHTILDFVVPKLDSPYAFGGGIAYYTSPFQSMFLQSWERSGSSRMNKLEMFPFYPEETHRELVDQAFLSVADSVPQEIRDQVLDRNGRW